MGGSPLVLVESDGIPITLVDDGPPFTPNDQFGFPATIVDSGGMAATLVNDDLSLYRDTAAALLADESAGFAVHFPSNTAMVKGHTDNFLGAPADLLTVTRASTATYFDAAGVMQTAAADTLRLDHNPSTLEALGVLIEEQRTNLLLNSETLSTQSVTVTAVAHTLTFYGTGTITLSGTSTAGPLVGTGASNRVSLTFTPTAGSLTLTVTGTVSRAQLETGSFATSYIPTAGSQVTRAADQINLATSAFPYNAAEGSVFYEAAAGAGTLAFVYQIDDGTNNERILSNAKAGNHLFVTDGGVTQADLDAGGFTTGVFGKSAQAFKANDFAASVDGGAVATDTSGTMPTVNTLRFGRQSGGLNNINGHIKSLAYVPRRLSNAELQARSA